jgi:hypothetical protein
MCTATVPASAGEALAMLKSAQGVQQAALGFLAGRGVAGLPAAALAESLRGLEEADAVRRPRALA